MKRCCCKFHSHIICNMIKRHQILTVHVLNRHAESHIRMSHFNQCFQRIIPTVKPIRNATDLIICLLQSFNTDTDSYFGEFLTECNNAVREISIRRYNNSIALLVKFSYDIRDILPYKRFSTSNIGKCHLRKLLNIFQCNFFTWLGRILKAVTHITSCITPVSHNYCSV